MKPSKNAIKAAKQVIEKWNKISDQVAREAHLNSGCDPWGPSLQDWSDACEWQVSEIAKIIDSAMKGK
jgi:hypothetical protein